MSFRSSCSFYLLLILGTVAAVSRRLVIFAAVAIIAVFNTTISLTLDNIRVITIRPDHTTLINRNTELANLAVVQADMPVIEVPAPAQEIVPLLFKSLRGIPPVDG